MALSLTMLYYNRQLRHPITVSPTMLYYNRQLRHPNSVTLMGACKQVNQLLNVMNYVAGCNLNQEIHLRLACNKNNLVYLKHFIFQMNSVHVGSVAKQIARVLAYMHSRDPIVIHQDLKPANVMVRMCIDRISN